MGLSRKKKKQNVDKRAWADWLSDDVSATGGMAPPPAQQAVPQRPRQVAPQPQVQPRRPAAQPRGGSLQFRRAPARTSAPVQPAAPQPIPSEVRAPQPAGPNAPTPEQIRAVQAHNQPEQPAAPVVAQAPQPTPTQAAPLPPARRVQPVRPVRQPKPAEPEPALPWPKPSEQVKPQPKPTGAAQQAAVSISINIPSFSRKRALAALKKRSGAVRAAVGRNRKRVAIASTVCALVLVGLFAPPLLKFGRNLLQPKPETASVASKLGYAKPPFEVVVPSTKPELATPDGTHSAYDAKKQSYSFSDDIGGKQITISQQQIPAGETGETLVPKAAKSFNATNPIKTGWGTAYIQTNQKYNSQVVVFSVRDVLMFIQSGFTVGNDQWIKYINALN